MMKEIKITGWLDTAEGIDNYVTTDGKPYFKRIYLWSRKWKYMNGKQEHVEIIIRPKKK